MVDIQIALYHHLFQISKTESKPEIPTDTQHNDFSFEMSSFEQRRSVASHSSQGTRSALTGLQHFQVKSNLGIGSEFGARDLKPLLFQRVDERLGEAFLLGLRVSNVLPLCRSLFVLWLDKPLGNGMLART